MVNSILSVPRTCTLAPLRLVEESGTRPSPYVQVDHEVNRSTDSTWLMAAEWSQAAPCERVVGLRDKTEIRIRSLVHHQCLVTVQPSNESAVGEGLRNWFVWREDCAKGLQNFI